MGRLLALLALLVALSLIGPGSASAAQGLLTNCDPSPPAPNNNTNCTMVYNGDPGESNRAVLTLEASGDYQVHDPGVTIFPQTPCFQGADNSTMECPADFVADFSASLGDGNDSIQVLANLSTSIGAGAGTDTMLGGPATDFLNGGPGTDSIDGGAGDDHLVGDDPPLSPGAAPPPGGGDDSLNGGAGNDTEDGQDGNDVVRGADGNDALTGGAGNDTFPAEAVGDGTDDVSGGPGTDTATYSLRTEALKLSLDDVANDGFLANATDNLHSDVENLVGGSAGDALTGSGSPNALDGAGGDDTIAGAGGDDALTGGAGADTESGGDGNDTLDGGADNDSEDGGAGNDGVNGGAGQDSLQGGPGFDSLTGGDDADVLAGGADGDALDGGTGDDSLDGGDGPDTMAGGDGVDLGDYGSRTAGVTVTLDGNPGDGAPGEGDDVKPDVENLRGGTGNDSFFGSAAANGLDGGAGEDYEDGGAGPDALSGGAAGDVLRSRDGQGDTLVCGPGPDFVVGDAKDQANPDCDRVDRGVNQKPKLRDSAVVAPANGSLAMSPAGIVRRVPLQDKVVLPLRSIVDTVAGAVRVTSAASARKAQSITLDSGAFDITQTGGRLPVTQFALQGGDFAACPATARTATIAAASKKTVVRNLWASGKGKFRTKGRYAAASVRGTRWKLEDRCDGTLVRVARGAVTVRDLVLKRNVVVRAGHTYLAAAKR